MTDELRTVETAVSRGVRTAGFRLKQNLRHDTISSGLGRRLSNAWRQENYPKHGQSINSATLVYSSAPKLHGAFNNNTTIRSKSGLWIAIPTDSAPKKGVGKNKRISPSNWPEHRFGPLRFVYRRVGPSLLVADNQRHRKGKRGGFTLSKSKRNLKTKNTLATVPMFLLYRQTRLKKRLDSEKIMRKWEYKLAAIIDREFNHLDAGGDR